MRILKNRWFSKWAKKEGLTDSALKNALIEMEQGLIDADLGGHVYKKRAPVEGQGKSGGLRTILAFKVDDKAFFLYGFSKNARENIDSKELKALKRLAKELFAYSDEQLKKAIKAGSLVEVK
ncbi:type II toxin-antitoxin system RelE/ParE family toxin [Aestuariibacter sp. GS-14]|uniref:type II toxin-antitoxin system RelE/ParE family toxin n=1 Tax=Aestuariibacter sp. GS-14 TaxID=2590670 RepID=UPI00112772E3|nr:type II toxin-antitoxin system RelE/ParE family toxin [Aestuariibacter sp. GS-14]TPV59125.1 type II toxin-antitoxin system RelE/ParE family toxin [Aestuariibacter sp. GS-14]